MSIDFNDLVLGEEFFTWRTYGKKTFQHFAVTRLRKHLEEIDHEVTDVALHADLLLQIVENNGFEQEHIDRMDNMPPERFQQPAILCQVIEGHRAFTGDPSVTYIICDGGHRMVYRAMKGDHFYPGYLVKEEIWKDFLIENMPDVPDEDIENFIKHGKAIPDGIDVKRL